METNLLSLSDPILAQILNLFCGKLITFSYIVIQRQEEILFPGTKMNV